MSSPPAGIAPGTGTVPLGPAGAFVAAGYRRWASYRLAALAGTFTNTVFGVIKVSILVAVTASAGGTVAGYDRLGVSTYTWVSQSLIAVVLVFGWTDLADRVRTGDIAVDLARPADLQLSWLAQDLGRAGFALVFRAAIPMLFGAVTFGLRAPTDPVAVALLPVGVALAVVVSFACRFLVNLVAFWLLDVRGVVTIYVLVSNLLCGLIIPVQMFPDWLRVLALATPFPALMQAPTDLVTGQATGWGAVETVLVQLGWAAGMLLLGRLVLRRAVHRLVVQGG